MANREMPRRGSGAYNGIEALVNLGGTTSLVSLSRVVGWKGSSETFYQNVIDRLILAGLVRIERETVHAQPAARVFLGLEKGGAAVVDAEVVGPRYVAPFRVSSRSRSPMVFREGAFDYRAHPSRVGSSSIEYKGPTGCSGAGR